MGMFRVSTAVLAVLLATSSRPAEAAIGGGPSTVLVDSAGSISRPAAVPSASNGVVAVVGDYAAFGLSGDEGSITASGDASGPAVLCVKFTAEGSSGGGAGARGVGAASANAGAVVVAGETSGEVERGLGDARAGRALGAVFAAKLASGATAAAEEDGEEKEKVLLIVAVSLEGEDEIDEESTLAGVQAVFDAEAAAAGSDAALDDLYEVRVEGVNNAADAEKVMEEAAAAASRSPLGTSVASAVAASYTQLSTSSGSSSSESPAVTAALLACDMAHARHRRSSRARLAAWKARTGRGLTIDKFGTEAAALLAHTIEAYDRDTAVAAGLGSDAAAYRLTVRAALRTRLESSLLELFNLQVLTLRRKALKSFESALLRATRSAERTGAGAGDERALARRTTLFAFDAALSELELPSLGLTKSKAVSAMEGALNDALVTFEDSPAAKLKTVEQVQKTAAKETAPGERSVDAKIDLIAMLRPDGFGNLQGFVGYQTPWGSQVTVGMQNDADDPQVISQFGGVRPPFLRVQPKLKLDIEL